MQSNVNYDPPYCYYEGGRLKFNSGGRNTGKCTASDNCLCKNNDATFVSTYYWNIGSSNMMLSQTHLGVCSTSCRACTAGTYSSECIKCPAGRYNSRYDQALSLENACKSCPVGRVGFEIGKTTAIEACDCVYAADCFACPVGTFNIATVKISSCPDIATCFKSKSLPGVRLYYDEAICQLCPKGLFGIMPRHGNIDVSINNCQ